MSASSRRVRPDHAAHAAWRETFLTDRALRAQHLRFGPCVDTAPLARCAGLAQAVVEPPLEALAGDLVAASRAAAPAGGRRAGGGRWGR